ncbi:MAG: PfkB family carbohydrate kinase [Gemmatimonadetes bacterium]|nr:PfkB family carbohydrate kinase [Gemmatimonadota bacterium]
MTRLIKRARLEHLLAGARSRRIAVVGDAMLDVYLRGDVDRISPEAQVPVHRVRDRVLALGGAANVAQNVAAIGCRSELVAVVGNDSSARQLEELLATRGCETRGLVSVDRPTTTKTRIVARSQQLLRIDEEHDEDCAPADVARILDHIATAIASADALILEDYNKGVLVPAVIETSIAQARARGIPIIVDPKYRNFFSYQGATVFKPNRRELEAALGAAVDLSHAAALPSLVARLGVESVLLTLSEHGMALIESGATGGATGGAAGGAAGGVQRIATTAREVYDVVGAGDTVTAYLAAMLAAGATRLEAAVIANYAAGIEVGKMGAATVSVEEVLAAFDAHGE